ncbi:MAG: septal ring lytic transglycosylase RlpA family protein [Hyphomicrobium sp.]|nr:septal ring lytic transglycosylase RlpA family protein [Hyphomicrobium sp.]
MADRRWFGLAPPVGLAISVAALLAACSGTGEGPSNARLSRPAFTEDEYGVTTSPRVTSSRGSLRKGGGGFKLGSPYKVAGRWYVPREDPNYDRMGIGSWYGDDFHGRKTANGEVFDMHALTAAHPTMPLPSYAYVTNLQNGRTILVRVNDRGPYVNDRIIDLSHASARALGYIGQGRARVRVRYAGRAPLNGDDRRERTFLASQRWNGGSGDSAVAYAEPPRERLLAPRPAPASTAGGWSPTAYRAALAGKRDPNPAPRRYEEPPAQTWSDRRMALAAPREDDSYRSVQRSDLPAADGGLVWQATPRAPARYPSTGSVERPLSSSSPAYVQVGMFRERGRAERLRAQLGELGPVEVAPVTMGGDYLYRVRIGPMASQEAHATLAHISSRGLTGAAVVSE